MFPDSNRDLGAKKAGGCGVREQKENSEARPSDLGSLNGFQIKAKGLPGHSGRGCFPGNLALPAHRKEVSPRRLGSLSSTPSRWLCSRPIPHKKTLKALRRPGDQSTLALQDTQRENRAQVSRGGREGLAASGFPGV